MRRHWFVAGGLLLALTACGDGGETATTSTAAPLPTTTTSAVTSTTGVATTVDDGTLLIEVEQSGDLSIVAAGQAVEAGDRIAVPAGSLVRIEVMLDGADEVHVHTYDLILEVVPGEQARLEFVADIAGIFEVELEGAGTLLFELEVS